MAAWLSPSMTQELLASFMYAARHGTAMAMSFVPAQTPATLSHVIAWWPSAYPGHSMV
jgi:hypothetical protein